jgi:hypothetical protein
MPTLYFGVANVVANGMIMLRFVLRLSILWLGPADANRCSSVVLWISQNIEDDYTYNLTL